jgi:hypothetical protein
MLHITPGYQTAQRRAARLGWRSFRWLVNGQWQPSPPRDPEAIADVRGLPPGAPFQSERVCIPLNREERGHYD